MTPKSPDTGEPHTAGSVMMSAYAMCPDSVTSHPARMRWIADYFLKHFTAPIDSAKVEDTGEPEDLSEEVLSDALSDHWSYQGEPSHHDLIAFARDVIERDRIWNGFTTKATAPTTGSAPVAEGWQLTETKNLDALIIAMERAENKGYLPDSIKEAWGEFMCNPARVAPASPAASVLTALEGDGNWRDIDMIIRMLAYPDVVIRQRAAALLTKLRALAVSMGGEPK